MLKSPAFLFVLIVCSCLAAPANAQMFQNFATDTAMNNLVMQQVNQQGRQAANANDAIGTSPSFEQSTVSTTYDVNKARTRNNLASFVNKSRAVDPTGAAQMEKLFASTDIIGQIAGAMRSVGLRSNDASHAYALWWVSAWKASRGDNSTADSATYAAVAEQARRGLASSAEFTGANDALKQEMAEALMVQAALIDGMVEEHASDPKMMAQIASAVRKGASASGIELDSMTLTPEGFAEGGRKRSDASDATEGEETALAAATPSDGSAEGGTNYALIAGAGGLGLGLAFLIGKAMGKKG
jgi:hypothetical protein